jgi:hypothetical protein
LIDFFLGVIPFSGIRGSFGCSIGVSGGADINFNDLNSWFVCNEKSSGYFLKG